MMSGCPQAPVPGLARCDSDTVGSSSGHTGAPAPGLTRIADDQRGRDAVGAQLRTSMYFQGDTPSARLEAPAPSDRDALGAQLWRGHREDNSSEYTSAPGPRNRDALGAQLRMDQNHKYIMKNVTLPVCDGSLSFKAYRCLLEKYFDDINCTRQLLSTLLLQSMSRGSNQAKEFYLEIVEAEDVYMPYFELIMKAENFFRKQNSVYDYFFKMDNMEQHLKVR